MTLTHASAHKRRHAPRKPGHAPEPDSDRTTKAAISKRRKFVPVTLAKVGDERKER